MSSTNENPSIRIPRVFPNISEDRIRAVFTALEWGEISKIDIVPRTNQQGDEYNLVFVHFSSWAEDTEAVRTAFCEGKEVKVVYDDPWYWRLTINTGHKRSLDEIAEFKTKSKPKFSILDPCNKAFEGIASEK